MLLRACMGVSRRQGDGSLGTLVVLDSLLRDWANPSGTGGVSDTEETSMQHGERVRCIMALNAMSFVIHHSEREIAQMMVGSGLWIRLNEVKWVRGLWMALLVPALNSRSALGLEQLLWNWVGAETVPGLLHRCRYALDNFERLLLPVVREGAVLGDSFFTAPGELYISGHCRDHSAVSGRLVCIKQLIQRLDPDTTMTENVTVETNSFRELMAVPSGRISALRTLAEILVEREVNVVFCSDSLDYGGDEGGAELFELASRGLTITDRVPPESLEQLAVQAGCALWISVGEALASLQAAECGMEYDRGGVGTMLQANRVRMPYADVSLRLSGLGVGGNAEKQQNSQVSQLLVHSGSGSLSGVYSRLLRRCLLTAVSTLESEEGDAKNMTNSDDGNDNEVENVGGGMGACIVPGAGASEMLWSSLWSQVADELKNNTGVGTGGHNANAIQPLHALARLLSQRLSARLQGLLGSTGPAQGSATLRLAALCRALSSAYLQLPLLLLRNHSGAGAGEHSLQRLLLHWRSSQIQNGQGRGWITFVGAQHTGNLAALENCFQYGVVGSARQFWASFVVCLDACTMYLRVSGKVLKRTLTHSGSVKRTNIDDLECE